ncbi:hypothetical protein OsI_09243 [Oryza sativa Indica Group]|uniref:Uncharacterized protein n=1 Tax=Oryza sativa subsp. indica TaxID=39946 RepID=B8AE30_ORYSI|nr:hypothetical protein OsI_09243 [Oryza sativa Indica Group]
MVGLIRIREVWLDLTAMHAEFHLPPYLLHLHLSASGSPGPTLQRHFSNDDGQGKYKKSQHRQLWAYMYTGLSLLPSQLAYGNGERNQKGHLFMRTWSKLLKMRDMKIQEKLDTLIEGKDNDS